MQVSLEFGEAPLPEVPGISVVSMVSCPPSLGYHTKPYFPLIVETSETTQ